jgi:hypothetical protein
MTCRVLSLVSRSERVFSCRSIDRSQVGGSFASSKPSTSFMRETVGASLDSNIVIAGGAGASMHGRDGPALKCALVVAPDGETVKLLISSTVRGAEGEGVKGRERGRKEGRKR